jgi:hypothetical protein
VADGNSKRWFQSIEAAAIAGFVFAVLSVIALALGSTRPPLTATDAEMIAWYSDAGNRTAMTVGLSLFVVAAVAFLWFIAVIRRRVGTRDDRFIATVFFGSGILITGVMLVAASAVASPAVIVHLSDGVVSDPGSLSVLTGFGSTLALFVLVRLQAVFVVTVSTLALRTGAFNRWLSYFGYAMGFAMFFIPIVTDPIGGAFPAWVGVLSVALFFRRGDLLPDMTVE